MDAQRYKPLYFDFNSTTPIADGVLDAVRPFLSEEFGNPSSISTPLGMRAKDALEKARASVAALVSAAVDEVVFTGGGTESVFAAIIGTLRANREKRHIIVSAVEHSAVLEAAEFAREMLGVEVTNLPVSENGEIDPAAVSEAIRGDTALLSVMYANNETGVIAPIAELAKVAAAKGVAMHTDAVQAIGKERVDFHALGVQLLSFSGHKFGAPKGVGALLVRAGTRWTPVVKGGGQEDGRRGGTENVPLLVGFGVAAHIRRLQLEHGMGDRVKQVRDHFEHKMLSHAGTRINGIGVLRLSNTSSVQIAGILGSELVSHLAARGISVSLGAACKAARVEPSHVLRAMGRSAAQCLETIRVSFGPESTLQAADLLVVEIAGAVLHLKKTSASVLEELRL